MIEFNTGDVVVADAEALVNTVNCVGIMGRGIALQFKKAYPANFEAYAAACRRKEVQPGRMFVYETNFVTNPKYIINFPTKRHWRGKSRIEDIEGGLHALAEEIERRKIRSIALPPLGSGLGGLDWAQVKALIQAALGRLEAVRVIAFEPRGATAPASVKRAGGPPAMTPGRAALVGLISRYLNGLMDPSVTLLEVHKLMYFMQEAGEPLRLRFKKAPYGPYAENLRHVLVEIEGYYIAGYADGGDAPSKELSLVPGAQDDADKYLAGHPETSLRFARVSDLVDGFETPFGLELLSTVHWTVARGGAESSDSAVQGVHAWGARKSQLSDRQIRLAFDVLNRKGWIHPSSGSATS